MRPGWYSGIVPGGHKAPGPPRHHDGHWHEGHGAAWPPRSSRATERTRGRWPVGPESPEDRKVTVPQVSEGGQHGASALEPRAAAQQSQTARRQRPCCPGCILPHDHPHLRQPDLPCLLSPRSRAIANESCTAHESLGPFQTSVSSGADDTARSCQPSLTAAACHRAHRPRIG